MRPAPPWDGSPNTSARSHLLGTARRGQEHGAGSPCLRAVDRRSLRTQELFNAKTVASSLLSVHQLRNTDLFSFYDFV